MNWEAFLVIGGIVLVLGIILLIPGLLWARYKLRSEPRGGGARRITKHGLVLYVIMIAIMLFGFAAGELWPDSWLGRFTGSTLGLLGYLCLVFGLFFLLEKWLHKKGVLLVLPPT